MYIYAAEFHTCSPHTQVKKRHKVWIHSCTNHSVKMHLCHFCVSLTTSRVLLLWPQWATVQGSSSGSQHHHTRAVRCPQAVGSPGSEEHPPYWQWGDGIQHFSLPLCFDTVSILSVQTPLSVLRKLWIKKLLIKSFTRQCRETLNMIVGGSLAKLPTNHLQSYAK